MVPIEILVVDDEPLVLRTVVRTLVAAGISATGEVDPFAALAIVEREPRRFTVLVTDMRMPGMSGLTLATRVRQLAPEVRIVLHSGNTPDVEQQRHLFDAVLDKPSSPTAMVQTVRAVVASRT